MSEVKITDHSEIRALIKSKLALAFIVKNEGRYALQMLKSVQPIVGFVSCVDTESDDGTTGIISEYLDTAGVNYKISIEKFTRFDKIRNKALENIPGSFEWIMMLDADEILLEKDFERLLTLISQDEHDAWIIPRYNWIDKIWGELSSAYPDHQGRLFRNYSQDPIRYVGRIHEGLSGYRNLGTVEAGPLEGGEFGDEIHIHHIKLFQKNNKELNDRENLYRALIEQSKMAAKMVEDVVVDAVKRDLDNKSEKIFEVQKIKAIHAVSLEGFDNPGQKAFWCEWNHPLETPRSFGSIIHGYTLHHWPEYIRPGAICIDIGAHSGDSTIPMAIFANDFRRNIKGKIFAIEPNPDVYSVLEINSTLNAHLGEIIPFCIAITDKNCEIEIFDHGNSNCNGGIIDKSYSAELAARLHSAAKSSFKAKGLNLEFFVDKFFTLNDLRSFSFIKIDCEGYDKEILRSAKGLIMAKQPFIQIEWFDWFTLEETADMFKTISEIGYVACHPLTGSPVTESQKVSDLVLVPSQHLLAR